MEITAMVTVPEYIYSFYYKVSKEMKNVTAEELMSRALSMYAQLVLNDLTRRDAQASDVNKTPHDHS